MAEDEDRFSNKPKRRSSLYTSTLDDLVVEDKTVNAVSTAEDLKVFTFPFFFSLINSLYCDPL